MTAGSLFEQQKVFDVVVWGTPSTRQDVSAVRNLLIDTPNGGQVRLGEVARVDVQPSPNVIQRDAVSRYVDVTAQVHGRSRSAVLADVKHRLQDVKFPLEYRYELVSNFADRGAIEHRLVLLGLGIAIGTFLLLQAAFANWRLAVLHFVTLRGSFSRASGAGFNQLRFSGRLRGRALAAGRYRLVAVAVDRRGLRSAARSVSFRIVR